MHESGSCLRGNVVEAHQLGRQMRDLPYITQRRCTSSQHLIVVVHKAGGVGHSLVVVCGKRLVADTRRACHTSCDDVMIARAPVVWTCTARHELGCDVINHIQAKPGTEISTAANVPSAPAPHQPHETTHANQCQHQPISIASFVQMPADPRCCTCRRGSVRRPAARCSCRRTPQRQH